GISFGPPNFLDHGNVVPHTSVCFTMIPPWIVIEISLLQLPIERSRVVHFCWQIVNSICQVSNLSGFAGSAEQAQLNENVMHQFAQPSFLLLARKRFLWWHNITLSALRCSLRSKEPRSLPRHKLPNPDIPEPALVVVVGQRDVALDLFAKPTSIPDFASRNC